jgi:hypothetical protein
MRLLSLLSLVLVSLSLIVSVRSATVTYYGVWVCNTFDLSPNTMDVTLQNQNTGETRPTATLGFATCTFVDAVGQAGDQFVAMAKPTTGSTPASLTSAAITLVANSGQNVVVVTSSADKQSINFVVVPPSAQPATGARYVMGDFAPDLYPVTVNNTMAPLTATMATFQALTAPINSAATFTNAVLTWTGTAHLTNGSNVQISVPDQSQAGLSAWQVSNGALNQNVYAFICGTVGAAGRGDGYKMVTFTGSIGGVPHNAPNGSTFSSTGPAGCNTGNCSSSGGGGGGGGGSGAGLATASFSLLIMFGTALFALLATQL